MAALFVACGIPSATTDETCTDTATTQMCDTTTVSDSLFTDTVVTVSDSAQ